ncbi:hypothetical protein, partial [Escherichia coli]|uniref:hypothetical protein n=1 Tax=Escherichia coli TaxID=562 RepID=UPI001BFE4EF3
ALNAKGRQQHQMCIRCRQKRVKDQENTLLWVEESTQIPVKIDPYFYHCFTTDTIQNHRNCQVCTMVWGERAQTADVGGVVSS